jgi:hypothetical protein
LASRASPAISSQISAGIIDSEDADLRLRSSSDVAASSNERSASEDVRASKEASSS